MAAISRLRSVFTAIRKHYPEMPAQDIEGLLRVAEKPGINHSDLKDLLGTTSAAVARMSYRMGERGSIGRKGHAFLTSEEDPADGRARRLYLTNKGQKFVSELVELMEGDHK